MTYFTPTPSICDECHEPFGSAIGTTMIDGPSRGPGTPWGCFCFYCWEKNKTTERFGVGIAQKYIRDETGYFKSAHTKYRVFTRTWWAYDENGELFPELGPEVQLCVVSSEAAARAKCREWNETHNPGPLSRRAEYTEV